MTSESDRQLNWYSLSLLLLSDCASHILVYTVNGDPRSLLSAGGGVVVMGERKVGMMGGGWVQVARCRLSRCLPREISSVTQAGN